jgi:hypothetical protein
MNMMTSYKTWRNYRNTVAELNGLSPRRNQSGPAPHTLGEKPHPSAPANWRVLCFSGTVKLP